MPLKSASPCVECHKLTKNYSCPTCRSPYCSVNCCKIHKDKGCQPSTSESSTSVLVPSERLSNCWNEIPDKDRLTEATLSQLRSPEMMALLQSGRLREALKSVDIAYNPAAILRKLMSDLEFESFAQLCLKQVDPNSVEPQKTVADMCDREVLEVFKDQLQTEFASLNNS